MGKGGVQNQISSQRMVLINITTVCIFCVTTVCPSHNCEHYKVSPVQTNQTDILKQKKLT